MYSFRSFMKTSIDVYLPGYSRGDIAVGTGTWGIAAVIPKYLCPCDYDDTLTFTYCQKKQNKA